VRLSQTPREGGLLLAQSAPHGKKAQTPNRDSSLPLLTLPTVRRKRSGKSPRAQGLRQGPDPLPALWRLLARVLRERKNTALFNTKIEEKKAISVAEHLSEGVSTKATSRLVGVSPEAVRRLRRNLGDHSREFHDERVRDIETTSVQMGMSVTGT
jgi:hypothetical protein